MDFVVFEMALMVFPLKEMALHKQYVSSISRWVFPVMAGDVLHLHFPLFLFFEIVHLRCWFGRVALLFEAVCQASHRL
jgi:hypothetical protein